MFLVTRGLHVLRVTSALALPHSTRTPLSAMAALAEPTVVVRLKSQDGAQLGEEDEYLIRTHAAPLLAQGELVAFPTETVYGLGANALSAEAAGKIFLCKGRPSDNPLIVHVASYEMLEMVVPPEHLPLPGSFERRLMERFWPGPLTMLFPKSPSVPSIVTAGGERVAVRMPSHPVSLSLIASAAVPVAAPSANRSGRPSPTSALHVLQDLARASTREVGANANSGLLLDPSQSPSRLDLGHDTDAYDSLGRRACAEDGVACVVDGGQCGVGVESTVVDTISSPDRVTVLRPGGVTVEQLERFCADHGRVVDVLSIVGKKVTKTAEEIEALLAAPPTPGLKYKHYSPSADVVLVEGDETAATAMAEAVGRTLERWSGSERVAVIHTRSDVDVVGAVGDRFVRAAVRAADGCVTVPGGVESGVVVVDVANGDDGALFARCLFSAFRALDAWGARVIVVEGVSEAGMGLAVMNRVRKAAGEIVST